MIDLAASTRSSSNAPRILVATASVGGGHDRAAEAIRLALEELCPEAHVEMVDILRYTASPIRTFYAHTYYDFVDHVPYLVGYMYDRLDRPTRWKRLQRVGHRIQRMKFHRFGHFLESGNWDLVIQTHFLSAEIIASLRRLGRVKFPHCTVLTDNDAHRLWVHDPTDRYFLANDEGLANFASFLPREILSATGIPVHPVFAEPKDKLECRRLHELAEDRTVVLQMAGGLGLGPVMQTHRAILDQERPMHVVTCVGRNAKLREQLEAMPCPPHQRRTVLGFTNRIDELMAAADVIVSKPGGLTSSEALARGCPMIIVDPIPGQESRNADYLLENGAAVKAPNAAILAHKLSRLLNEPERLQAMRKSALAIARPRAAFDVVEQSLALIGVHPKPIPQPRREPQRVLATA